MPILVEIAKKLLPKQFKDIIKEEISRRSGVPSVQWSMANMCRLGFKPSGIIDVGAFNGEWSLLAHKIFPDASILMFEPQEHKRAGLEEIKTRYAPQIDYRTTVLGAEDREQVVFHQYLGCDTASSMLNDHAGTPSTDLKCGMETLDSVLKETKFPKVDFIKLDVQGYELEVLRGGARTLASTEAVLMEVSLIDLYEGNPIMHEVIAFMRERNFNAYDICTFWRRGYDKALWQIDMIFVKKDSVLLKHKLWS